MSPRLASSRSTRWPVFAHSLHPARSAKRLTSSATLYTNGSKALAQALLAELQEHKHGVIRVDTRPLGRLTKEAEGAAVTLHFADDSAPAREGFLVHRPRRELHGPFAQQLGLARSPQGDIQINLPFSKTCVPGVFSARDCVTL